MPLLPPGLQRKRVEINKFRLYQLLLVLSAPARDFRIGCFGEEAGEPRVRVQGCECTEEEAISCWLPFEPLLSLSDTNLIELELGEIMDNSCLSSKEEMEDNGRNVWSCGHSLGRVRKRTIFSLVEPLFLLPLCSGFGHISLQICTAYLSGKYALSFLIVLGFRKDN